jgi:site-specific recombinase XerD
MKITMNLLFYLKKPKNYTGGPAPIYIRISVDCRRVELTTGRECEPERWCSKSGRALGAKEDIKSLNANLDQLQGEIYDAYDHLKRMGQTITSETLKNQLLGKPEPSIFILDVFKEHNRKVEALVGREFAPGTLERYKTSLKHTRDFIQWKYKLRDLDIKKVNHSFITEYDFYLRTVRKCANNSAVKYLKNFGKIVRICLANGWITVNPFLNYKAKVKKVDRVFLDQEELDIMSAKTFASERIAHVRDIFLFSCYTGLAYADVKKLKRSEIVKGIDGELWIYTHRQKTDTPSRIPLLPVAVRILDSYKDHPICEIEERLLPVLSNQKMNEYLKEIAEVCGIPKELTYHIARHTFATTVTLLNGVPIETVSKMLGHTSIRTTQHYAKTLDIKVSQDMMLLKKKLNGG